MKKFANALVVVTSLVAFASAANASTKEVVKTTDGAPTAVESTTVSNDMGNTTTVNTMSSAPAGGETVVKKKKDSHHLINLGLIKVF